MLRGDALRLRDMHDAAVEAIGMASSSSREDLELDRKLSLALVKLIEIIGEAAANMTGETREGLPDVPWRNIIGMRNRLIHAYFDVDLDTVWETVKSNLPPLVQALSPVVDHETATSRGELFKRLRDEDDGG